MRKFNVYDIYYDDGQNVGKIVLPAESEKQAKEYLHGNGDVVAIRKDPIVQDIDLRSLTRTLQLDGWGSIEIEVITRALEMVGLDRDPA